MDENRTTNTFPEYSPKGRKGSYTKRTTEATDLLDLETEEGYRGPRKLRFNE